MIADVDDRRIGLRLVLVPSGERSHPRTLGWPSVLYLGRIDVASRVQGARAAALSASEVLKTCPGFAAVPAPSPSPFALSL